MRYLPAQEQDSRLTDRLNMTFIVLDWPETLKQTKPVIIEPTLRPLLVRMGHKLALSITQILVKVVNAYCEVPTECYPDVLTELCARKSNWDNIN